MTRTAQEELIVVLEGFLILVVLAAGVSGLYWFVTNFWMIPLWAYPVATAVIILSYAAGRIFERSI